MDSIDSWKVLSGLKSQIKAQISKIIIFGENGSEVIFSTRDGKVYGFGNNKFGELGFGHKRAVKDPQNILELNDNQIIDFSYGLKHVLAQTITGNLYSWGDNSYGQRGIGTNASDCRAKLIDGLSDKCVIDIKSGFHHTLVLTDNKQLYGFGRNNYGQIGVRHNRNQLRPMKIIGFNNENVISISCGANHSLALTQSGNVYSWGNNSWGQLGIGNQIHTNIPIKIIIKDRFKQISCGSVHSLLLSNTGDVYAFGYNSYGSLGTGDKINNLFPVKINDIRSVTDIASNFRMYISMAKLEDNKCLVWGQCLSGNIVKPIETQLMSFNDVIVNYSNTKITLKPIEWHKKQIEKWDKINKSFNDKDFSDIVFRVENNDIFVNKLILKLKSDYFRNKYSVISTVKRESSTQSVEDIENIEVINNYSYQVFYSYLKYLYTDCIEIENQYLVQLLILSIDHKEDDLKIECLERIFTSDNNWIAFEDFFKLMKLSIDKNLNELKIKCIDRIESMRSIDNICDIYKLSDKYGLNELKNNCIKFMRGLRDKNIILSTDSYRKMSDSLRLEVCERLFTIEYIDVD